MIYLVSTLFLLFICAYYLNNKEFMSPSVLFSGSLLFGAIWAFMNENKWSLNLNLITYLVISIGVFEFILISYIVKMAFINSKRTVAVGNLELGSETSSYKSNWGLLIVLIIQIIAIFEIVKSVKLVTGNQDISQAIALLNASAAPGYMGPEMQLPRMTNILFRFSFASGIFFGFHFVKKAVFYKKIDFQLLLIFILGIGATLLTGSRGYAVYGLVAFVSYYYFFTKQKSNWEERSDFKYIMLALFGIVVVASIAQWSAAVLGRNVDSFDPFEYISVYVGAEIKNLDVFIQNSAFPIKTGIWGKETFQSLVQPLGKLFGWGIPSYKLDLPFQSVNGHTLGNVYTTFYPWLYDFGYMGVGLMVALMATLTQSLYSVCRNASIKGTSLSIMVYGYFSSFIALAFFSNKFFENINVDLLFYVFFWIILKYLFFNKSK